MYTSLVVVVLESSSCVFPHRFHQIFAVVTNFAHIVPVLSSNSEPILKIGLIFAYELGFRRSIYQNRSEFFLDSAIPIFLGSENFNLVKNWSQNPIFVVISFLSFLSTSSKISTGHVFHLFRLIFSVVTSFVLLSEGKISKKEKEKVKISQKNNDNPKK